MATNPSIQVLILGIPRMGTQSIADALIELGYPKVYHMREVGINKHQQFWVRLIEAKASGAGDQLTREDFEPVLKDYQALADFPATIFGVELIKLYPDAQIIVPVRDEDKWFDSMRMTLIHGASVPVVDKSNPMVPLREAQHEYCWKNDFEANGRSYFRNYYAQVRAAAPERTLLYKLGDGWKPICDFLGKPVPEKSFPHRDDWRDYKAKVAATQAGAAGGH